MTEQKKGSDGGAPKPTEKASVNAVHLFNYNRVNRLCLGLELLSFVGFLIAYHKAASNALCLCAGILITAIIIQCAMHPIIEEEEDK